MAQQLARRVCDACSSLYQPIRVTSRYCSDRCRKRAQRANIATPRSQRPQSRSAPSRRDGGLVTRALLVELEKANRLDTALGQAALAAAQRVDLGSVTESGSAFAALNRDFRAARAAALEAVAEVGDALDELARRREERLASGR